ncbi:MAG: hypothetical protein AAF467_10500 [Actinomycetota bacterium]
MNEVKVSTSSLLGYATVSQSVESEDLPLREQYLLAGERLLDQGSGLVAGLDALTVKALVSEVGGPRSRSSFHATFGSRDAYIGELLERVLTYGFTAFEALSRAVLPMIEQSVPPFDVLVRDAARANFEAVRDGGELTRFREALSLTAHETYGPTVEAVVAVQYERLVAIFEDFYRYVLPIYRLRVRDGISVTDLVVMLAALIEGFVFTWEVDSRWVRDDVTWNNLPGWGLFPIAAHAIIKSCVEEMPPDPTEE